MPSMKAATLLLSLALAMAACAHANSSPAPRTPEPAEPVATFEDEAKVAMERRAPQLEQAEQRGASGSSPSTTTSRPTVLATPIF